jgi:hypothetical protein
MLIPWLLLTGGARLPLTILEASLHDLPRNVAPPLTLEVEGIVSFQAPRQQWSTLPCHLPTSASNYLSAENASWDETVYS